MTTPRLVTMLAVIVCLAAGCDPVRTTLQPVHLQITDASSREAVPGAQISVRYDYVHDMPLSRQSQENREWWDEARRFSGVTDEAGRVSIGIKDTTIDHTRASKPPRWRDVVSGKLYLVLLKNDQLHEELSLLMSPGASIEGKSFSVSVLDIQKPQYVKTSGCTD